MPPEHPEKTFNVKNITEVINQYLNKALQKSYGNLKLIQKPKKQQTHGKRIIILL